MAMDKQLKNDTQRFSQAVALHQKGQLEEAFKLYKAVLADNPNHADAIHLVGVIYQQIGKAEAAIREIRRAIKIIPNNPVYHNNLGAAYLVLDNLKSAAEHFRKAMRIKPDYWDAVTNLADCCYRLSRFDEAIDAYQAALRINPNHLPSLRQVAMAQLNKGDFNSAEKSFHNLLEQAPEDLKSLAGMAILRSYQGQLEKAEELCKRILAIDPRNIDALIRLITLGRSAIPDNAVEILETTAQDSALKKSDQVLLYDALAKAYDSQLQFDTAFHYYQRANQVRSRIKQNQFNLEDTQNRFATLIEVMTPAFFKARENFSSSSTTPIFIVGMPRSGTSLVEQILSSHSQVFGAGELDDIGKFAGIFSQNKQSAEFKQALTAIDADMISQLAQAYLQRINSLSDHSPYVVDKMPQNFEHLWLIKLLFPNAKIIHCQRDPMDTCFSCYVTNFTKEHGYKHDLRTLGQYYKLYETLMAHWQQVFSEASIFNVPYESLVDDPENRVRDMLRYCELEWQDSCLEFYKTERVVRTASYMQVKRKMYRSSVGRWKHYEAHLLPLKAQFDVE